MTYIGSGFSLWDHARFEGDAEGSASASGGGAYGQSGLDAAAASVSGTGPSPSSPAGGAQAASGGPGSTSYGPAPAGNVGYGPSPSSPAGGSQAASGYGPGNDGASVGYGPSPSSPAGGAQAAAGYGPTGYGPSPAESIGYGPSPSSPAGGAQAAAGYGPAAYSPTGFGPSPSSPAGGAMAAAGFTDGSRGLFAAATPTGLAPTGFTAPSVSARQAETESLDSLYNYGNEVKSVIAAGNGWTTVQLNNGTVETRSGVRGSRNNNPGNIEYGPFAQRMGAVGTDGRFAVFSSPEAGRRAMESLVFGPNYAGLTIANAISRYAPPSENNTNAYADAVARGANVTTNTVVGNLTPTQRSDLISAMISVEGSTRGYRSETVTPGQSWGVPSGQSTPPAAVANVGLPSLGPVPESRPAPTMAANPQEDRVMRAYEYAGLTRSLAPANPVTYSPEQASRMAAEVASPASPDDFDDRYETTFADRYLSTPETAPVPSDRPSQPTQQAATPAAPSVGGRIAAGAIDVAAGLIPGIGIGAGLFNAGAQLTGNQTLGERAVEMFQNAPGPTGEQNVAENDGAGQEWRERAGKAEDDAETETGTPAERFERTYLYVRDLPTPQQRWGRAA